MPEPRIVFEDRPWIIRLLSQGWLQVVIGLVLGLVFASTFEMENLSAIGALVAVVGGVMLLPQVRWRLPWSLRRLLPSLIALGLFAWFFFLPMDEETALPEESRSAPTPIVSSEPAPVVSINQAPGKAVQDVADVVRRGAGGFLDAYNSQDAEKFRYTFQSDPSGASLSIEGTPLGQTPLTLDLPVGSWSYRLQMNDDRVVEDVITVSQDDTVTVVLP